MADTLFLVIGGPLVALAVVVTVYAQYRAGLTVPPKSLARKWRAETRGPRR